MHTPEKEWGIYHRYTGSKGHEDEVAGLGWQLFGPPEPSRGTFAKRADAYLVVSSPKMLRMLREAREALAKISWAAISAGVKVDEQFPEFTGIGVRLNEVIDYAEGRSGDY